MPRSPGLARPQAQNAPAQLDVVIFKDCFQSLLETAFELGHGEAGRPRARYMIASQGLIPVAIEADEKNPPKALRGVALRQDAGLLQC